MLGVTLHGFIDFKGPIKDAIFNHDAHVKVLLLDPGCEQFRNFAERLEPHALALKGESQSVVRYIDEINESIETTNKERMPYRILCNGV